ncbi:MFS transporter [Solimonas marina]|uniref:MFS transporter n=1 Tax=Solimonas marina TaxID=2714601 RepID=A0A969WAV4_9GAMM|nr:MFS transporter [Solimonas marina]NKF23592.1 MFS transporter [Solimonas marina]
MNPVVAPAVTPLSSTESVAVTRRWTQRGTAEYRRMNLALFLAGFASFSLMYCVQPLLVPFARQFHLSATGSSLALSLTTGVLAISIPFIGALSERYGRRGLMAVSMISAAILNLLAGVAPTWSSLLVLRALEGLALGGVPAVAMTYLAEEIEPQGLGFSMGLYVSGTAFGGMLGRVGMGMLSDIGSWRTAMMVLATIDLAAAIGFVVLLPRSKGFVPRRRWDVGFHVQAWKSHLSHGGLIHLFALAFVVMGMFVTIYNYAGFRLSGPEFGLDQTRIGFIFLAYILGMVASPVAGLAANRWGRVPVLVSGVLIALSGIVVTLTHQMAGVIVGIALITVGFFSTHSLASAWVGRLGAARKGHAAALYLLAYYLGSSLLGSAAGDFWQRAQWHGVVAFTTVLLGVALSLVWSMRRFDDLRVETSAPQSAVGGRA